MGKRKKVIGSIVSTTEVVETPTPSVYNTYRVAVNWLPGMLIEARDESDAVKNYRRLLGLTREDHNYIITKI
jgi:hypothetical protein